MCRAKLQGVSEARVTVSLAFSCSDSPLHTDYNMCRVWTQPLQTSTVCATTALINPAKRNRIAAAVVNALIAAVILS